MRLLEEVVASQTAPRWAQLRVLGAFAAIAFLLAAVGIHGVLSFAVSTRTQEVGVRMALGATRWNILLMFLRQGLVLGVGGVVIAMPLAYGAARGMTSLLFGVHPGDPSIYVAASLSCLDHDAHRHAAPNHARRSRRPRNHHQKRIIVRSG